MPIFKKIYIDFLKVRLHFFPRFAKKYDLNKILEFKGIQVGKNTIFYDPKSHCIDLERPFMLEIGDYCKIARGFTCMTHDYSRSVLRRVYGDVVGEADSTIIGNNVFFGVNCTVLMGAKIGDNVIVGANSLVKGKIPSNVVCAGNPAKIICTLEEYYKKKKANALNAAVLFFKSYVEKNHSIPDEIIMRPFFYLWAPRTQEYVLTHKSFFSLNGDEKDEIIESFFASVGIFANYQDFVEYAKCK